MQSNFVVGNGPSRLARRTGKPGAAWRFFGVWLMMLMMAIAGTAAHAAAPPAGTPIGNQASATYKDQNGSDRNATSNTVITIVQQVDALDLIDNRNKQGAANATVYFSHTVTNNGNGPDSYTLGATNVTTGDSFDLTNVTIYADANGDGVPDDTTPLTVTPTLAAGASFSFVVAGLVPITASPADTGQLTVTATSVRTPALSDSNTDTVTVSDKAIIDVTKAIDTDHGTSSPQTTHTYTLTYKNNGIGAATDMVVTDVLNSDLVYVGNPHWTQETGTLTTQATFPATIPAHYASPWQAGNGAAHIIYSRNGQTVKFVISDVASGETGKVTFQVMVKSGTPPSVIPNVANFNYNNGDTTIPDQPTNKVDLTVDPTAGVTGVSNYPNTTGNRHPAVSQGATLYFVNTFTNTGTGADTFDVTIDNSSYPAGTTFKLYKPNSAGDGPSSPLTDTNGNTIPDTGSVAPGASYKVILQVTLPAGASDNTNTAPYSVDKTATSTVDPSVSTTVDDALEGIDPSTVDLLNGLTGSAGINQGPETNPVTTMAGDPGTTVRFTLRVRNLSAVPDNYDLLASGSSTFSPSPTTLPSGVSVVFRNLSNGVITNTGNVLPDDTGHTNDVAYYADVTIPAGAAPVTAASIYFQTLSPNSGALDKKHDAITINRLRDITIEPNHTGQTYPGNSIVYSHTVTNNGNAAETVKLVTSDVSTGVATFTSTIYIDNGTTPGVLDSGDTLYVPGTTSDLNLPALGSQDIFVMVHAPSNAVPGNVNETDIKVNSTDNVLEDHATDTTTIVSGQLTLRKYQSKATPVNFIDANLNLDPGEGIFYHIVVTNNSAAPVTNVLVNDDTPQYSTYFTNGGSSTSVYGGAAAWTDDNGTSFHAATTAPATGNSGPLVFNIGTLAPGQSVDIYFSVKIDN